MTKSIQNSNKKRILVVDDEAQFRCFIREALERHGFKVEEAADVNSACERTQKTRFDLVISDMNMPGLSGVELLFEIKSHDPTIPVIIITGLPQV